MSVRMHASVLWRGAVSLGMRPFPRRSAAMLGQVGDLIHEVYATEQERSLAACLRQLPWPDAGGEATDGGEVKLLVELDCGAILRGDGEGELAKFHGAQRFRGGLHEHAAEAVALVAWEDADLRGVANAR